MARQKQDDQFYFEGFVSPNTTPVPDVVFDRLLGRLKEAELKALLYIIRRTFGWHRDSDSISFNQFLRGIRRARGESSTKAAASATGPRSAMRSNHTSRRGSSSATMAWMSAARTRPRCMRCISNQATPQTRMRATGDRPQR
jgi:hypothetical protein